MKIAIFTDSFLPTIGGTENAVNRLATALSDEHEVMVLAPDGHSNFPDNSLPFKVSRAKSIKVTANDFWAHPSLSKNMKKRLEEFKPDIVHSHTVGMMTAYANKYAKKHKIPSVVTVHTKFRYCYKDALKLSFFAEILLGFVMRRVKKADRVCTVSNMMIPELNSYGIKKPVTVIRNGNDAVLPVLDKKTASGKFNILFVGRIIEYKNIKYSLDILSLVKKVRSDFIFTLVGRGPHVKRFKKYAEKVGLKDNVEFIGAVTDKQKLKSLYRNADLFLFTSLFDSDGMVVLESAEQGTPSLVLEDMAMAERITDDKTGFIAKHDLNDASNRILSLMDNREKLIEVGKNAHEIFKPWTETAKEYVSVYEQEINLKRQ